MNLKKQEKEDAKALKAAVDEFYAWPARQRAVALLAVLDIIQIRFEADDGQTLEQLSPRRYLDLFDLQECCWLGEVSALRVTRNQADYAIPATDPRLEEAKTRIKRHKKQFKKADDADAEKFSAC